jgi:hypothetical protein
VLQREQDQHQDKKSDPDQKKERDLVLGAESDQVEQSEHRDLDRLPPRIESEQAVVPTRQAKRVLRRALHDLRERDRRDRQVVAAEADGWNRHQGPGEHRDQGRRWKSEPGRPPIREDEDRHRVGADRHETGLAEVDDPGEPDVELQAEGEDAVDPGDDPDAQPEVDMTE